MERSGDVAHSLALNIVVFRVPIVRSPLCSNGMRKRSTVRNGIAVLRSAEQVGSSEFLDSERRAKQSGRNVDGYGGFTERSKTNEQQYACTYNTIMYEHGQSNYTESVTNPPPSQVRGGGGCFGGRSQVATLLRKSVSPDRLRGLLCIFSLILSRKCECVRLFRKCVCVCVCVSLRLHSRLCTLTAMSVCVRRIGWGGDLSNISSCVSSCVGVSNGAFGRVCVRWVCGGVHACTLVCPSVCVRVGLCLFVCLRLRAYVSAHIDICIWVCVFIFVVPLQLCWCVCVGVRVRFFDGVCACVSSTTSVCDFASGSEGPVRGM